MKGLDHKPDIILVPCAASGRAGCEIVARAVEMVARDAPEVGVVAAEQCPRGGRQFVVAVDGSSACRGSEALEACGCRASAIVSAPAALSRAGLVRPGVDVRGNIDRLAAALAEAIRESVRGVLEEVKERRRYQQEMAPVVGRFHSLWGKMQALGAPDGEAAEEKRRAVDLLGKRARNLFVRFDEVSPPGIWAEAHDLFQDALLCMAYACEGWVAGDAARWEQNLEKARVQVRPLLARLGS